MGGLFYKNKFLFACFAIGGGALGCNPIYHDRLLLKRCNSWVLFGRKVILLVYALYNSLYWVGVAGAFLTSIYTFRLIWVVFFGEEKTHYHEIKGATYWAPLSDILAVLSTGLAILLKSASDEHFKCSTNIQPAFEVSQAIEEGMHMVQNTLQSQYRIGQVLAVGVSCYLLSLIKRCKRFAATSFRCWTWSNICRNAFGFDSLYDNLVFVQALFTHSRKSLGRDPIDGLWLVLTCNRK